MSAPQRINNSVLGVYERPALAWMASRLMRSDVTPDQLTALGVFGALMAATGYVASSWSLSWLWLACAGLALNWLGDSLDGTLARLRRIERPRYGFFIDHTTDLFCQTLIFVSLGLSPLAHFGVTCLGLIVFLMAFVYTLISAHARGTMRITYFFFGPTEIRMLLLLGNVLTLAFGLIDLTSWLPAMKWQQVTVSIHDAVIALLSLGGVIAITLLAGGDARLLDREDPPPRRSYRG